MRTLHETPDDEIVELPVGDDDELSNAQLEQEGD